MIDNLLFQTVTIASNENPEKDQMNLVLRGILRKYEDGWYYIERESLFISFTEECVKEVHHNMIYL